MIKKGIIMFTLSICATLNNYAQSNTEEFKPTMNISGFTNIWATYASSDMDNEQYGLSVRYFRIKASGNLLENVSWTNQFSFDKGNPTLLDVYVTYNRSKYINVRFGQFPVPGIKSGVLSCNLWSTTKQILNDRSTITQNWGSNSGLSSYRSLGGMFFGSIKESLINYYIMLATSKAGTSNYFNASVKSPGISHGENGLAIFSRLEIKPIKEMATGISFHTGNGNTGDTIDLSRMSYSTYFMMRKSGISTMIEYIAGKNETSINDAVSSEFSYNGLYVELAYKLQNNIEPVARFDIYSPLDGTADNNGVEKYQNITLGCNYYPSQNLSLMFNYVIRGEETATGFEEISNNLAYCQVRYKFKLK